MERKLISDLEHMVRQSRRRVRQCIYLGCSSETAKNHCVSQALMASFADQGHIRHLHVDPWTAGQVTFQRLGAGVATVFHGLCNQHDHVLFKPVDSPEIEVDHYRNQVLLSFRCLLHEKLKKTIRRESYGKFSHKNGSMLNPGIDLSAQLRREATYNLQSVTWFEQQFLKELDCPGGTFLFHKLELPYYEVAGSEVFTFEPGGITQMKRQNLARFGVLEPFSDVFVHLVPSRHDQLLRVLIGAHEKDRFLLSLFVNYLRSLPPLKALSDLLLLYLEDWVCSESFYLEYLAHRLPEIVQVFVDTARQPATSRATEINLW